MKTTIILVMMVIIMALVLAACSTAQSEQATPQGTAEAEQPILVGCGAIPTLGATLKNTKVTLDEEQKELLMEKEPRIQRRQKFKVMKLDIEVKNLEKKIAGLQANCS